MTEKISISDTYQLISDAKLCDENMILPFLNDVTNREYSDSEVSKLVVIGAIAGASYIMNKIGDEKVDKLEVAWQFFKVLAKVYGPVRLIDNTNMLNPDNAKHFDRFIYSDSWKQIQDTAATLLRDKIDMTGELRAHLKSIVDGQVPFGIEIKEHKKKGEENND